VQPLEGESLRKPSTTSTFGDLGTRPWLVLGGGGLKGLAHVGAWRALVEAGVRPQGIVGTSIGALIGVLASSGMSWEEMREHALAVRRADIVRLNRRAAWINGIRQPSLFRGNSLMEFYERLVPPEGWNSLRIPVLVNAVDLADGSTEWFGTGARTDVSVAEAVYASSALPVFYPPFVHEGRAFVDGGSAHPLALDRAEAEGATGIIGCDPGAGEKGDIDKVLEQGMLAVHERVFAIMTWRRRRDLISAWDGPPLMYVRPRLEGYGTFDFDHVQFFLDEGYRAMKEALGG
jgi:NTE family protein